MLSAFFGCLLSSFFCFLRLIAFFFRLLSSVVCFHLSFAFFFCSVLLEKRTHQDILRQIDYTSLCQNCGFSPFSFLIAQCPGSHFFDSQQRSYSNRARCSVRTFRTNTATSITISTMQSYTPSVPGSIIWKVARLFSTATTPLSLTLFAQTTSPVRPLPRFVH